MIILINNKFYYKIYEFVINQVVCISIFFCIYNIIIIIILCKYSITNEVMCAKFLSFHNVHNVHIPVRKKLENII